MVEMEEGGVGNDERTEANWFELCAVGESYSFWRFQTN